MLAPSSARRERREPGATSPRAVAPPCSGIETGMSSSSYPIDVPKVGRCQITMEPVFALAVDKWVGSCVLFYGYCGGMVMSGAGLLRSLAIKKG